MLAYRHVEKSGQEDGRELEQWHVIPPSGNKEKTFLAEDGDGKILASYTTGVVYLMSGGKTVAVYELAWK